MDRSSRWYGYHCEHCHKIHGPYSSRSEAMLSMSLHWFLVHPNRDQYTVGWPNSMNVTWLEWQSLKSARYDVASGEINASGNCNCTDCRSMRFEGSNPEKWPLAVECKKYNEPTWKDNQNQTKLEAFT